MRVVKLVVATDSSEVLVTWGAIPPFNEAPRILVWGDRFFRYLRTDEDRHGPIDVFAEAFAIYLVQPDPIGRRPTMEEAAALVGSLGMERPTETS